MENLIYNRAVVNTTSKEEELQAYFTSIDTDMIENNELIKLVDGAYAKKMAQFLLDQVPNLINTDLLTLKLLCELLQELEFINEQLREARNKQNLMVYHKFYKLKLDGTSKALTLLDSYGLTPKGRKTILALDMEEN
ncbi:MAG: hypothetical protein Q4F05_02480 [bacterium]|nr:hypothetical protein [bacterium]